jgi:hypothetical protein
MINEPLLGSCQTFAIIMFNAIFIIYCFWYTKFMPKRKNEFWIRYAPRFHGFFFFEFTKIIGTVCTGNRMAPVMLLCYFNNNHPVDSESVGMT